MVPAFSAYSAEYRLTRGQVSEWIICGCMFVLLVSRPPPCDFLRVLGTNVRRVSRANAGAHAGVCIG